MNRRASILPGRSAAGISIGCSAEQLLIYSKPTSTEVIGNITIFRFEGIVVWLASGVVDQVCVSTGYQGRLPSGIGIGSTIRQVIEKMGAVKEDDEDNLVVSNLPGWCFDTEAWAQNRTLSDNLDAKLTRICVFGC